jgi:thiamine biosynthesis lipoprotein
MPILIFCLTLVSSCRESVHKVSRPLLGTIINLTIVADTETASKAAEQAFKEIERIEFLMSPYRESSDIFRINTDAWREPVRVSGEVFSLVKRAVRIWSESDGAFDVTFASMSGLWNFKKKGFVPPSIGAIRSRLALVGSHLLALDESKSTVAFTKRGTRVGLGAIAKGYAVNRAVLKLKGLGLDSAIVEAGGDLQVLGDKFGKPWMTGLRHPRKQSLLLTLTLQHGDSIATSGDYERFTIYQGKRYHHIIDPRTGYPADTLVSVSVISKDPVISDSYATAIFVMGMKKARQFLRRHGEIQVIIMDCDMKVYISEALKERVKLLEKMPIEWI